jgi:hypothetical protein
LRFGIFWGNFSRRGTDVSTLKIGSRGAVLCFGGIKGFYAVLRREYCWGNLVLLFFEVVGGNPRRFTEEGGQLVFLLCLGGALLVN